MRAMIETRAQANLVALGVALLLVTGALGMGLVVADGAFHGATRDPLERRAAASLADRLVAADAPLTYRTNVLNATAVARLDPASLAARYPVSEGFDVRIRLDDRTLVETGDPTGGVTVRRVVLVGSRERATLEPALAADRRSVTLPRRTDRAVVSLHPPVGSVVRTVRANGRVLLHDPDGLRDDHRIRLSRYETVELRFEGDGPLPRGAVEIAYFPETTIKAVLVVTVDG